MQEHQEQQKNQQQPLWRPVGSALRAIDDANRTSPKRDILILGAGISGLVAAYELGRRGHTVEIIEATKDRVGGRLWTWRSPDGRFHGERSAMRIPSPHDYSLHYVREAGLDDRLRPFVNDEHLWAVGGERFRPADYPQRLYPRFAPRLREDERPLARNHPGELLQHYMQRIMRPMHRDRQRRLLAGDFSDPVLRAMDQRSWKDSLSQAGASPGALELLGRLLGIAAVWDWSLATLIRDGLHQQQATFAEIRGGFDQLPQRIYQSLKERQEDIVEFGQEVHAIDARGRTVKVRDRSSGRERDRSFDHLLVTLPFPVLERIQLRGFSREKLEAIPGIRYASACKDLLAYEERFWESDGIRGGRSRNDGPDDAVLYFREAYYPMDRLQDEPSERRFSATALDETTGLSFETEDGGQLSGMFGLYVGPTATPRQGATRREGTSGPATLLGAYTLNEGARALQAMSTEDRREALLSSLEQIHGPVVRQAVHYVPWSWDRYPWTRGGLALTPPQRASRHMAAAKRSEGQVYFSGEHVSMAPGWIQGSLESTLREVEAILRSPTTDDQHPEEDTP